MPLIKKELQIPLLGTYPGKKKHLYPPKDPYKNVPGNHIHNYPKLEATKIAINWIDRLRQFPQWNTTQL